MGGGSALAKSAVFECFSSFVLFSIFLGRNITEAGLWSFMYLVQDIYRLQVQDVNELSKELIKVPAEKKK